jgi:hypothetical protein
MGRAYVANSKSDVMRRTGATLSQMTHWGRVHLPAPRGTGNHRVYTEVEIALVGEAVKACRIWGPSAARAVFVEGRRL